MKIRTDFVTNSSSSSFIVINVKNPILAKLIEEYKEKISERLYAHIAQASDDEYTIHIEEAYIDLPNNKNEIIEILIRLFSQSIYFDEYETEEEILEKLTENLAKEIYSNKDEIMDNMIELEMTYQNIGWQGDDDSRYDEENYSKKYLKKIYKEIAEEYDIDIDEVDEDMFAEYVSDKTSIEEDKVVYKKETGKIKKTHNFYLEDY